MSEGLVLQSSSSSSSTLLQVHPGVDHSSFQLYPVGALPLVVAFYPVELAKKVCGLEG